MKKIIIIAAALLLLASCTANSGKTPEGSVKSSVSVDVTVPPVVTDPSFEGIMIGECKVNCGSNVPENLPEADEVSEVPSCAGQGNDTIYKFGGNTEVSVCTLNGVKVVYDIYIFAEGRTTPEGIGIGSGLDEIKAAYGEDYTEFNGEYRYTRGRVTLSFLLKDGKVTSIDYSAKLEQ